VVDNILCVLAVVYLRKRYKSMEPKLQIVARRERLLCASDSQADFREERSMLETIIIEAGHGGHFLSEVSLRAQLYRVFLGFLETICTHQLSVLIFGVGLLQR